MEYTKHISISERDGHSVVTVDDYELFDYLDDYFVEKNISAEFISQNVADLNGDELLSMYFKPSYTTQFLLQQLSEIPIAEIERIHALNNHKNKDQARNDA